MEKNIQALMDDWRAAKNRVVTARRKEFGSEMEVRRAIAATGHVRNYTRAFESGVGVCAAAIEIGHWDCESSPIEICVYDGYADPMQDSCLYCGLPEDRK